MISVLITLVLPIPEVMLKTFLLFQFPFHNVFLSGLSFVYEKKLFHCCDWLCGMHFHGFISKSKLTSQA